MLGQGHALRLLDEARETNTQDRQTRTQHMIDQPRGSFLESDELWGNHGSSLEKKALKPSLLPHFLGSGGSRKFSPNLVDGTFCGRISILTNSSGLPYTPRLLVLDGPCLGTGDRISGDDCDRILKNSFAIMCGIRRV